jgi:hypothetical protein
MSNTRPPNVWFPLSYSQCTSATEDTPSVDLPAFLCSPLGGHPFNINLLFSLYTFKCQAGQASQVIEYEDGLEDLRTGKKTLSDLLLQVSLSDSDSDD